MAALTTRESGLGAEGGTADDEEREEGHEKSLWPKD
jgi:hypothetical protein